ncbi:hypothetical protein LGQ02_18640 [Bacillus shivajii]|uniref:hypothetical protein n=1 Tax=Bacillus shivajii TaxID=1983719 RepID=UPI001CFC13AC|nr:hypothetical protein [Bacillus shivajii]UCZ52777.1 hypothetical protein LGQ02_18640 [Bacillus shivajii]
MTRKLIIITGHFGSGKTELALHTASQLKQQSDLPVSLCDIDVVNPYFRSRDYEKQLLDKEIHLVAPRGDLIQADLPIVTGEVSTVIEDQSRHVIIDVGGDKDGALALGQFSTLLANQPYEFWFVSNANRPYVSTVTGIKNTINEIEQTARLKVTGLINNTHLGDETFGADEVIKGEKLALEAEEKLHIPYMFSFISSKSWNHWEFEGIQPPLKNVEVFNRRLQTPWTM